VGTGRVVRWWIAGLVTVAAFGVTVWLLGALVLPLFMSGAADRWVVASGAGAAAAALVALWGQSWVTRESSESQRGVETYRRGVANGPSGAASGERTVIGGGDITGIVSTGDNTTNIQRS
jgi:hypothetical protein